jgi:hypothetical protein
MNYKWENLKLKNLLMFEDLTSNISHLINICRKTNPLQENPQTLEIFFLHKLRISRETCKNGKKLSLTHLKFEAFNKLKTFLPHTSNFNVETFNNLKNLSSTHFKLQC